VVDEEVVDEEGVAAPYLKIAQVRRWFMRSVWNPYNK
jgi:hypothetical protein